MKANDTIRVDLSTGKILDFAKFEPGNVVMIAAGNSMGRVGVIQHRDRHPGSFEIIHVKDAVGHTVATRLQNVFGSASATSLGSRYLRGMVSS